MSQVTIHHPSSYGYSGQVGLPASVTGGSSATFQFAGLTPGAHTVTWGGGTPTTNAITVAADGTASAAHTYPAGPGTYTMYVTEDATGRRVAQRTIVLPYTGGGGFAPKSIMQPPEGEGEPDEPENGEAPANGEELFDPGEYTVAAVVEYAEAYPEDLEDIIAAEEAGKARTTLLNSLYAMRP